jgi:BirA family biotin operon repressor/biotin-[acetyl-CoA-carboxylase] ligase
LTQFPLSHYEETASTSSLVKDLLKEGREAPFAVYATRQTAGRGRLGNEWQSPEGNIYLSLALPKNWFEKSLLTRVPFLAGYIIAEWLKERFKINITLKWPNDLYFAGRKLGGILSETVFVGDELRACVVGIGINVKERPDLPQAATLKDILPEHLSLDIKDLCQSLVDKFAALWEPAALEEAVKLFSQYGLVAGQPWLLEVGSCYRQRGVKSDGTLEIENDSKKVDVTTLSKGQIWGYQQDSSLGLAVADIGNSRIKLAIFGKARQPGAPTQTVTFTHDGCDVNEVKKLKALYPFLGQGVPVFWLSVNDQATQKFLQWMRDAKIQTAPLPKRPVRLDPGTYQFEQIGIDRLALSEAVLEMGKRTFVALSAGTATTIEVVRDGVLQGGYILAGIETKLRALNQHTGKLPLVEAAELADATSKTYPKQTKQAIGWGAVLETAAFVERIVAEERTQAKGSEVSVIVTGGLGLVLERHIRGATYVSDLVSQGARIMALGGVNGSNR